MKILVAPNSFKECADSAEIADVICRALKKRGHEIERLPISDGGDGFLKVCREAFRLTLHRRTVSGCFPGGRIKITAGRDEKDTFYLEAADFIGLRSIPETKRNPLILNSRNLGEYIKKISGKKSAGSGKKKIIAGIGGTGTSDLGLGLCVPFGLRLFDKNGNELDVKPLNYAKVKNIILPGRLKLKTEVVLDVKVPLFGRTGTSRIFSPQKGASQEDVILLEKGVKNILRLLKKEHGLDYKDALIGAGGGLTLGLMLISETKVTTSREFLINKLGLRKKIRRADLVISGEGKIDYQSYLEKATGIVIEETLKLKKRIIIIAGSHELPAKYKKGIELISLMDFYKSKSESIRNYKTGIEKAVITILF